jgi:hypothetical protein
MGAIIGWIAKNGGLLVGVLELVIKFVAELLIQLAKLFAGLLNIFTGNRLLDKLVNWVAKAEVLVKKIDEWFTKFKGWLYAKGVK